MYKASVITVSDRASSGLYADKSGPAIRKLLEESGYGIANSVIVPDDREKIREALLKECEAGVVLILTTGGTGFAPNDVTPEVTRELVEKKCPGITEYMRIKSMEINPRGMLARSTAGIRGGSLIINLPGSTKGAVDSLSFVLPQLAHGLDMLRGMKE